ncbi:MAG: glycosidase [Thermofilum sp. ex4484_15]|nr:MAG: glycosidase [Thermofilum sp. ex4484_15]
MGIVEVLEERQIDAFKRFKGLRKPLVDDVFKRVAYLGPEDFKVEGYKRSKPSVAFNPGATVKGRKLILLPRLIFDYFHYTSSIGLTELDLEELLSGSTKGPLATRIVLWPKELWEFLGCEDPRVFEANGSIYVLYTGKGYFLKEGGYERRDVQGLAVFNTSWQLMRRGHFRIKLRDEIFIPRCHKDSAILKVEGSKALFLTRPRIGEGEVCWSGWADLTELIVDANTLRPLFVNEDWEWKVGWSTNALKLSKDEYLVGWHGVLKGDNSYRNGLALINGEGELKAISDYLLAPKGAIEEYGDRPLVIFGDGLVRYKEYLIWVGGISDYAIAIFATEMDKALEKLRTVSK